jgi:hypothetical protein
MSHLQIGLEKFVRQWPRWQPIHLHRLRYFYSEIIEMIVYLMRDKRITNKITFSEVKMLSLGPTALYCAFLPPLADAASK